METQQLEFVLAVMKTGSFTQAAKRCFTSRQNIAHAVKSVEREFGVELFWREGKNLKLTDDGKAFSEKAQAVINLLDDMHDIANENRRSLQPIGVVVSTALLSALPADASGVFFDYPGGIRISESGYQDCVESVCAGLADGAFVVGMNRNFNMCDSLRIATIPVYAWTARSSSLATEKALKLEMLGGQRLLLVSDDKLQYGSLMQSLQNSGIHDVRFSTITGQNLPRKSSVQTKELAWYPRSLPNAYPKEPWRFRSTIRALAGRCTLCTRHRPSRPNAFSRSPET